MGTPGGGTRPATNMPSDIKMEVDFREFGTQIARLAAASRRTNREVVQQQARLVVVDLIKCTPPTGNRPLTETFGFQRRKGEMTADRDIHRLFQPLTSIKAVMYPTGAGKNAKRQRSQYLKHLAEKGDWNTLSQALFHMGVTETLVPMQGSLELGEYRAAWKLFGARGNVSAKRARRYLVWDSSALERVRTEVKNRVGWAKAGWMTAARALGVKRIPSWIADHPAPGGIEDGLSNGDQPSFTVINAVSYISYLNSGNRLLVRVLRNRERAMEISIEHALQHFINDFNNA